MKKYQRMQLKVDVFRFAKRPDNGAALVATAAIGGLDEPVLPVTRTMASSSTIPCP
jgi:hypothetical protein